ncbi:PREDICTED: ubiquitin carboxyl-terminal hydrolase isozyme L3-like [Amphimedon queenslandica]|uniref:Ubiquitin carboxyl-terminal hydrolase n=1 Tax=Amphimedon queenslandica TaxID=400682 RepID=A0A1X7UR81_AMPQE|nr:PREDICTED: ubiquitin carboxyl-terminal hydrolase isozyme L3-like [Amphimedon queenslandica]|eukprot:XP_003386938.1 PREDICTED: ubiquitin carboxyl-terminal hydrolase isozyme L3-like [Amphimedon queenslandica]
MASSSGNSKPRWLPLEANPEVMNKYVDGLGVGNSFQFCDVFGLDPDLLMMIPQPCAALVMLFPITDKYEAFRKEEEEKIEKEGQTVSPNVYYMKQYVGNACGTIGLLHVLCNNISNLTVRDGYLKKFYEKTKNMTPEERGHFIEEDEEISEVHETSAQEGDTAPPSRDEHTHLHFVALVQQDGHIYELDGRKSAPVNHGSTTPESFLNDAANVCQKFMTRDPDEIHFTIVALAAAQ